MKKIIKRSSVLIFITLFIFCSFGFTKADGKAGETEVYLCGFAAGFEIKTKGASILKVTDVVTESGIVSPSAGILETGDMILSIGNVEIDKADDVSKALSGSDEVVITLIRGGEKLIRTVTPVKDVTGSYKLGLMLKDGTSGIGTMTFIKKSGEFMALGHPIVSEDGSILPVSGGELFRCSIFGVNRSEDNRAGELKGLFIGDAPIGKITKNLEEGIFGIIDEKFDKGNLPLIKTGDAAVGKASIVTCIDGVIPKEYSVTVVKSDDQRDSKNLVIKVTDKELLSAAGGIVQGMSGSPIVQNGRLVGAVTHVFVNDPTRGYGISIENMLNAA